MRIFRIVGKNRFFNRPGVKIMSIYRNVTLVTPLSINPIRASCIYRNMVLQVLQAINCKFSSPWLFIGKKNIRQMLQVFHCGKEPPGVTVNSIRLCVVALQALLLKRRKTMASYCSTRRLRALERGLLTYLHKGTNLILFTKGSGVHWKRGGGG